MQHDAPSSDLRQRLELVGLSYVDWEIECEALRPAADEAAGSGPVDAHNLVRAGDIADAIDAELVSFGEVSADIVDGETAPDPGRSGQAGGAALRNPSGST